MNTRLVTVIAVGLGALALLLMSIPVDGGNVIQASMKGTIRDETGKPLDGVDVFAIDPDDNDKHTTSEPDGSYEVLMPAAKEVRVVLFDTGNANAKRMTVALHIDATAKNEVSWVLKPVKSLDKNTREYFMTFLRELAERTKSERLKKKITEFLREV